MPLIALVACRALTHGGQGYARGEVFMTDPVSASILVRRHDARLIDKVDQDEMAAFAKRRYLRRDLQAFD